MCDDLADREKRRVHTSQRPTRCSSRSHEPKLPGIYLSQQPTTGPAAGTNNHIRTYQLM